MRGGQTRAAPHIELARLARKHGLTLFLTVAEFLEGWVNEASGMPGGLERMRRAAELLKERGVLIFDGLLKSGLAGAEARAGDRRGPLRSSTKRSRPATVLGYRAYEAELHRVRGELLLEARSAGSRPRRGGLSNRHRRRRRQGARSFGLRAALSLAKLYQSTARPADAHAVLAPALEGFASTPEMPEIAQAQALLGDAAGEVKAQASRRQRLTQLQLAYGNALFAARGSGLVGFPQPRRPRLRSAMTALRRYC